MAQPATRLTRRLVQSARPLSSHSFVAVRTFTTTTSRPRIPALADIDSTTAASFDAKQKEFRERHAASKAKADSQSPKHTSSPSSASDTATAAAAATSASEIAAVHASSITSVLGSQVSDTGEARKAARAAENPPAQATSSSESSSTKPKGVFSSIVYGTQEGREHEQDLERSFSQVLARGKYVHSIVFHEVKPDKVDEYVDLVGGWYPKVAADPKNKVHLVGSWRTEVGDCDTFGKASIPPE